MEHDSSDILGHNSMPVLASNQRGAFPLSLTQALVWSSLFLGVYVLGKRLWKRVLQWRERSYRLATRRRHGIPDSDLRPFNVAYSEAMMRAREEESRKLGKPKPALRPQPSPFDQPQQQLDQNLRHRQGVPQRPDPGMRSTVIPVPGGYNTGPYEPRLPSQTRNAQDINHASADTYHPRHPVHPTTNGFTNSKPGLARHGGYLDIADADMSDVEGRKRALDEEQEESEHEAKKSRVEGDELIDGDEDAEFEDLAPKRGSKRGLRDEEDGEDVADSSKKARGKRARKVSQEKGPQADSSMDVDDEEADEITELKSTSRGKKRDRAEAGSTFGGDDEGSEAELEVEGDAQARRRRKRRTVAKRKSEASYMRAKKHGERDISDSGSEGTSPEKAARKKRGKRASHIERRASKSDVSMDESTTSTRSKVRNIGDEWESNGVKYKIGPNGQRLRQALVKKARQKFVMPKDSQHPDRDANLQVCVETWLTEEEYQDAKAQHLLAWQDSPPPRRNDDTERLTLNTSTSETVPFPHGVPGKSLLWSTSTSSTPTISPGSQSPAGEATPSETTTTKHRSYRDTYRHSIATTVGLPISPFINASAAQVPTAKRIASNARAISMSMTSSASGSPGLSDSTNGSPRTPHKVFSKWEKQELEARAMMKIREANRKKEMEKEMRAKEERERAERERERVAAAERLRVERERVERERQERERQEMDRREKERQAKEAAEKQTAAAAAAAAAAPPQITVTPPTASSQPSASTGGAAVPNFFAPKADQPGSAAASGQPQRSFSFAPSGGATAAAQPASTGFSYPPAKPEGFSFAPSGGAEQKKEGGAGGGNSSLLSRLGPQGSEAPKTPGHGQGQGQPNPSAATAGTTNPMFSFAKPVAVGSSNSNSNPNPFGQPAAAGAASTSTAPPAAGETTTPKFNFGIPSKSAGGPAAPVKAPISAFSGASAGAGGMNVNGNGNGGGGGTSSLSGALGSEQKSPFSFKTPTTPASASAGGSTTPATAPKFSFGPSPSAFGGTNGTSAFGNTGTGSSAFGNTSKPSAFGGGSSAFGSTTNANTASAFGGSAGSGPSPFGATAAQTSNLFGSNAPSKPAAPADGSAPKQFSFGPSSSSSASSSTTSATVTPGSNNPVKAAPTFSFATPQTPAAGLGAGAGAGAAPLTFKFGGGETGAGSTTPQSSPFGAAPASAFSGFGGTGAFGGGSGGGGVFGAAANANGGGAKQQ